MSRTDALSREVASALAERLNAHAPARVRFRAVDREVVVVFDGVDAGGSVALMIVDDDDDRSPAHRVETAVRATLSAVQDCVSESLTWPWPGSGGTLFPPDARVRGDVLDMWFGAEARPELRLESMVLGGL